MAKFIVIEGLEGAGKSTAIEKIKQVLQANDLGNFVTTREPGGTPLAEAMRRLVKEPHPEEELTIQSELLLMYAARSQLVETVIKPALKKGQWVIGDRHDLSSQAYQGGGRGLSDIMGPIRDAVLGNFRPDLTLYLDIDPSLGLSRARARGELDRIELNELSFFERARNVYLREADRDSTIKLIDASQSIEQVALAIEKVLNSFIQAHKI
ncbi:dTMP kinase [Psychrobium sp. 1_MG-2023]|uniref:dTMP kinase n=1 Tax=Psychrobium sp. 1_MG-2023 TaxID=3062624 RepID=UPI000C339200|nr:dTMP kinase [Psychrobium sp. 1_MG-2023]MDP2561684.1 dTMP kinase [Psychrobium sp. 1_MG-2023]PKF57088.1 dTMP kinase [Alteromonadales bacterium alter-6D02]